VRNRSPTSVFSSERGGKRFALCHRRLRLTGVSELSTGLLGSTIVAADGFSSSGDSGTTEGYKVSTNAWSALASDANPRNASCFGVVSGLLYVTGDVNGPTQALTTNESFSPTVQ
jgi:hypothetical protein